VRPLRADAARNYDRIARAAREVYAELGADAPLDEIAHRAGVGISTLFRRFEDKRALVRAALHLGFLEQLVPQLEEALADDDPHRGLMSALEAAIGFGAAEHRLLAAASDLGARTMESTAEVLATFTALFRRAREAGVIRGDLVDEDVPRILAMLFSVLATMDPSSGGWRRYIALVADGLAPEAAHPLPA
jgi:AcrR family transcriptional regulator